MRIAADDEPAIALARPPQRNRASVAPVEEGDEGANKARLGVVQVEK